jgi:pantetheine-phosphate adenylyltransferase
MSIAVYPGTFDPVTYGHIDMIHRAAAAFDSLVIGILRNYTKKPLFDIPERIDMLCEVTKGLPNVKVRAFEGLVVDFCKEEGANVIVRGIRSFADFEFEQIMAQTNRKLDPTIDTMFLTTSPEYSYVSSSSVRELVIFNGDITAFVPESVQKRIYDKISKS